MTRLGDLLNFGQFLRPLATINLTKTPTFLGNFCKGVEIIHFSSEIIFGQLLKTFGDFVLVTLSPSHAVQKSKSDSEKLAHFMRESYFFSFKMVQLLSLLQYLD